MRNRFWRTRGFPQAPRVAMILCDTLKRVLIRAADREFTDEAALDGFIETELKFPLHVGYGGKFPGSKSFVSIHVCAPWTNINA